MSTKAKVLMAIIGLGILDAVIPGLPIIALILIYVIVGKPAWFPDLVGEIYRP
jgi:hypothetical protein